MQSAETEADAQQVLMVALKATDLFNNLDIALLQELAAELTLVTLSPDQILMQQGDAGDSMYVVLEGQLRVMIKDEGGTAQFRRMIDIHETIGEIALLTGQTRTATIIADGEVKIAKLTKVSFEQLTHRSPDVAQQLANAITELIRRRQLRTALDATRLFKDASAKLRQAIETELELLSLRSGEMLFHQGDIGDGMYIVINGRLQIVLEESFSANRQDSRQQDPRQNVRVLRELGRGESLGEIALLTGQPRTASVYAIRDSEIAKLSRESYERLVVQFPLEVTRIFTQPITNLVVSRDRRDRATVDTSLTITLIPAGPNVMLTEFSERLAKALAQLGPTLHLNNRRIDTFLGKEGIAQTSLSDPNPEPSEEPNVGPNANDGGRQDAMDAQLVNWLGEQEAEYRYLLYEADSRLTPWTQRAVRQADHLLIVGHGSNDPKEGKLELALKRQLDQRTAKHQTLVLLQRGGRRAASGTAQWLAKRQVQDHYHVRWHGGDGDVMRLARILAGKAVGLVLSGGGARGAAHLGVLRAMQEAAIPIDMISGVSAGSQIAALYAMGYDLRTMHRHFSALSRSVNPMRDATLPFVAFSTGTVMAQQFKKIFDNIQIEDLILPFFCVSANLSQASDYVHRTGSLWEAVRASTTVPGIVPPLVHGGDLLIDGGLYNNLPLDVMRTDNPDGIVIGVDVMPAADLGDVTSYETGLSGWQALRDQLLFWQGKNAMPNIARLLYRTLEVSSVQSVHDHLAANLADLYLRPAVSRFGFSEFRSIDKIAEIGYQQALQEIADWQQMQSKIHSPLPQEVAQSLQARDKRQSSLTLPIEETENPPIVDTDHAGANRSDVNRGKVDGLQIYKHDVDENQVDENQVDERDVEEHHVDNHEAVAAPTSKLKSAAIFDEIAQRIATKGPSSLNAIFQYNIRGVEEGHWIIDLKSSPGVVKIGQAANPDCTISMSDDDFLALAQGKLNPRMAYMRGKLRIEGDLKLARKLIQFLK